MTDEQLPDFDLTGAMPFDEDARGGVPLVQQFPITLGEQPFAYIGRGLTLTEFGQYVREYDFGPVAPDFIVLHHTAIPSATWAPYPSGAVWDANENSLTEQEKYDKRKRQLDALMRFYRAKGWTAGPHLFIDERWIWLFTPMYNIGIHAAQGNSRRRGGRLHYSIGIEVIGYHEHVPWHPSAARLVAGAVALLKARLNSFNFEDKPYEGGVGAHRMYNKPECPGAAIVASYYMPLLRRAYDELIAPPPAPGIKHYRAKTTANVRSGSTRRSPIVDELQPGAPWAGVEREGDFVRLDGWGAGDTWICNPQNGRCVWANLLAEVEHT